MLPVNPRIYKMSLTEDERTRERDNTEFYLYISKKN